MSTSRTHSTTRQDKAIELIQSGAVTLNLDGTATVRGSGKAVYTVSKQGCTCPDYAKRGADLGDADFMCKHRIAARALCQVYRQCQREARETGRTRLPANLALALLRGKVPAPKPTAAELNELLFGTAA